MILTVDRLTAWQSQLVLDLRQLAPELIVSATILLVLLARMLPTLGRMHSASLALGGTLAALMTLFAPRLGWWELPSSPEAFTGMLKFDPSAFYLRVLILISTLIIVVLSRGTNHPEQRHSADFATLLLGSSLGLMLMSSANHLAMLFLALEMASLPSYVLSGFARTRASSEAALKYVLFGAASAGTALYGVSLIVLSFGTGRLPELATGLTNTVLTGAPLPLAVWAGLTLLLVGLGFKLAIVPFHFWLPDVLAGASAEVGGYLSVASKVAAVGLLARVLMTLQSSLSPVDAFHLPKFFTPALVLASVITMSLGNLAALGQTNLKRLLAYSTIAHAGYMLLALATLEVTAIAAVYFYLAAYLLMNLGAFAVVAILERSTGSSDVATCQGLLYRSPLLAGCFIIFLLSLLGLPPLAGFLGKFQVFAGIYAASRHFGLAQQSGLAWLTGLGLAAALINTVLSAGYYLKLLKVISLDEPTVDAKPVTVALIPRLVILVLGTGVVVLGIYWWPLTDWLTTASPKFN